MCVCVYVCEADFSQLKISLQFNQMFSMIAGWGEDTHTHRDRDKDREADMPILTRYRNSPNEISKSHLGTAPDPAGYQDGQWKERLMVSLQSRSD